MGGELGGGSRLHRQSQQGLVCTPCHLRWTGIGETAREPQFHRGPAEYAVLPQPAAMLLSKPLAPIPHCCGVLWGGARLRWGCSRVWGLPCSR